MNEKQGKILVIDDNEDILSAIRLLLKQRTELVHTEKNPERIPVLLKNEVYDVILLDMNFAKGTTSGGEGFRWLSRILAMDPSAVVILITAYGDIEMAIRAIKEGATDFILKPWQNEKLLATLSAALSLRESRNEARVLRDRQDRFGADLDRPFRNFIGHSRAMTEVFASIEKVARTDANVLILGENGTGKELAAREIHRHSARHKGIFVGVDMGAIADTLFESELFGHVRGAFTDAREDRAGRFEVASGGTLFLDEIGNISISLQAKLLTVLENRQVFRVGSSQPIPIDVRLICATNLPIREMVTQNRFRQDLLYRINTVEVRLPALRERAEDIRLLADHFLAIYVRKYGKPINKISQGALHKLENYHWPGNVRELQHAIERAVIMSDDQVLQPDDFLLSSPPYPEPMQSGEQTSLDQMEKAVISRAIKRHGGNVSRAAQELGISRAALYRRMEKYDL